MNKLRSLLDQKGNELKTIDEELPNKLESLIELTEKSETEKLIKENNEYLIQITEKNKEINDLKNRLKTLSEDKDPIIKEEKEINEEKTEKEDNNENDNDNINDLSKEQEEKEGEKKKVRKKIKKKKKKKKEGDDKDEEIEENKEDKNTEKEKENIDEEKVVTEEEKKEVQENNDGEKEFVEEKKEEQENLENIKENEEGKEKIENNNININNENIEEKEKEKKKEIEIDYKEEYLKLKNLVNDYEQGNIISEKTKNEIDEIKTESLSQIKELRLKIDQLNSSNLSRLKEYEILITNANIELSEKNKTIEEYESIALKQEDQINLLNKKIYELNKKIFQKNLSMKENETYSTQLIHIINEHKLAIKKIKAQKQEEENEEIALLRRENINLKNEIELGKKLLQNMKLNHRSLQDKYLNICYKAKKKEQDDLLKQAKILTKENANRKINNGDNLKFLTLNKSSSTSALGLKKFRIPKNQNKIIYRKFKNDELNLPEINSGNGSIENGHMDRDLLFKDKNKINYDNDYDKSLDEINSKLKKIIDES